MNKSDELGRTHVVNFYSLSIGLLKHEQSVVSMTSINKVMQSVSCWDVFMIFEEGQTALMRVGRAFIVNIYSLSVRLLKKWAISSFYDIDKQSYAICLTLRCFSDFRWGMNKSDELGRTHVVNVYFLSKRALKNEESVASMTSINKVIQSVSRWDVFMTFEEGWTNLMWVGRAHVVNVYFLSKRVLKNEESVASMTLINKVMQSVLCWDVFMTFKEGWTNLMRVWRAHVVNIYSLSMAVLKNEQSLASMTSINKVIQSVSRWDVFMTFDEGWTNLMSWEGHM